MISTFQIVCVLGFSALAVKAIPADHSVSPLKLKEAAMVVVNDCKTQEGASDDDVKALQEHKLPNSEQGLCMLQCLFNTARIMKNGKLDKPGATEFFTPAMKGDQTKITKMKEMMELCEKEIGNNGNGCQVAKMIAECTSKHGKEFGITFPNHIKV